MFIFQEILPLSLSWQTKILTSSQALSTSSSVWSVFGVFNWVWGKYHQTVQLKIKQIIVKQVLLQIIRPSARKSRPHHIWSLFQAFYDLLFEILAILMYSMPNLSLTYKVRKREKWIKNPNNCIYRILCSPSSFHIYSHWSISPSQGACTPPLQWLWRGASRCPPPSPA